MTNALLTTDACAASTASQGLVTSWTLAGSTTAYADTLTTTDGYSITASMTWKVLTTDTTETTKCAAVICVIGTCVQTMDSAGVVVAATGKGYGMGYGGYGQGYGMGYGGYGQGYGAGYGGMYEYGMGYGGYGGEYGQGYGMGYGAGYGMGH